jgi:hypothetical protein
MGSRVKPLFEAVPVRYGCPGSSRILVIMSQAGGAGYDDPRRASEKREFRSVAKRKSNRGPAHRPQGAQAASSARRLGNSEPPPRQSVGAQRRRASAASRRRSRKTTYSAIGIVLVIAAVFVVIAVVGGSSKPPASSNGVSSGQDPVLASVKQMVDPVTTIPLSVYNSVGVYSSPLPQTVTKGQTRLTSGGLPRVVYLGAEYCPFCAMARWSMVAALSRFGTFADLKMTASASTDGNIPTFSFLRSTYTSPYLVFTPYESLDRNQNSLQSVPSDVNDLYTKYDGNDQTDVGATPFNTGKPGIPFLDFANAAVSSGDPSFLDPVYDALEGGGPASTTAAAAAIIASSLHDPSTAEASAIGAKYLIALANYYSADICQIDGGKPASVCNSKGVMAATAQYKAATPVG